MTAANLSLLAFAFVNLARVIAYVPQVLRIYRDKNGAEAVSVTTWALFSGANLTTVSYALIGAASADFLVAGIFSLNTVGCLLITGLTLWRRRPPKGKHEPAIPRFCLSLSRRIRTTIGFWLRTFTFWSTRRFGNPIERSDTAIKFGVGFILATSLFAAQPPARADELIDALALHSALDYETAFPRLLSLAERGGRDAQTRVGVMYWHGEGIPPNDDLAIKWLTEASRQGSAEAPLYLARIFGSKETTGLDPRLPSWLAKAAERGMDEAAVALGELYLSGRFGTRDYDLAIAWFQKGTETYDPSAFFYLGVCYSTGLGVVEDHIEAAKWFELAMTNSPLGVASPEIAGAYLKAREHLMPFQAMTARKSAQEWMLAHAR